MTERRKNLDRDVFSGMVLEMLSEGIPFRDINLRQVAKRVGCAHTNVYNYVSSYGELTWFTLAEALRRMLATAGPLDPDSLLSCDISELYVDFALTHPSWYRLIWMEQMPGAPPAEIIAVLGKPGAVMEQWFSLHYPHTPEVRRKTRMFHSYLHGVLSKVVMGRTAGADPGLREEILQEAALIRKLIFTQQEEEA